MNMNRLGFPMLGGMTLMLAGPALAQDGADVDALRAEVASLRAEVATLRQGADPDWLTQARADQIRGLVHDVLADADTRSSLLQGGLTAGHDGKFFLASADGNFRLNIAGQVQPRFVYNMQDSRTNDEHRAGFEPRRVKFKFTGHVIDPSWKYGIVSAFDDDGGELLLDDAWIEKDMGNGWSWKAGSIKGPFMREELVSSSKQLTADRSLVNEAFNQDRSDGVQIAWKGDAWKWAVMYSDGLNTAGFGGEDTEFIALDTEFAVAARAEFLLAGTWKQFDDFTSWGGDDYGLLLGVAAAYEKAEFGENTVNTAAMPEDEMWAFTADASMEFGGSNFFISYVHRTFDVANTDQDGIVIHGGMFVTPDEWEVFARYEYGNSDMTSVKDLNVVTVGVNRYYARHAAKWTADIGYGLNEVDSFWASDGVGYRADSTGDDGQIVVRTQFQLLF